MAKTREPSKKIPPYCDRCNKGFGYVEHHKKLYCFKCIRVIRDEQQMKEKNGIIW